MIPASYSYMYGPSASVYTAAASRTSAQASVNPGAAVTPVPAVPSNEQTERRRVLPAEVEKQVQEAFDKMRYGSPRNAEDVNGNKIDIRYAKDDANKDGRISPSECSTCKERTYVDGSNESNVSFKTPGHISPAASASVVSAHEHEHVANAIHKGNEEGVDLISVSVSLKTAVCPECGTVYVSGGTTHSSLRYEGDTPYEAHEAGHGK